MEDTLQLPPGGSAAGNAFLWEPAGGRFAVYIAYDVVDRLNGDVVRGFGAVPKRGAEIGGILLGRREGGGPRTVIRIEDYVEVPCEHRRGPAFLLSERDLESFEKALAESAATGQPLRAVGYFRSHTREDLRLGEEDVSLLDARFPDAETVVLLVRPFPAQVSEAVFLFREEGKFSLDNATAVLPFRRRELGGGRPPKRRFADTVAARESTAPEPPRPLDAPALGGLAPLPAAATATPKPAGAWRRFGWAWALLSVLLLLLGVAAGLQVALRFLPSSRPAPAPAAQPPPPIRLTVSKTEGGLTLKWTPSAELRRNARRATLSIEDGRNSKTVEMSREDFLRGGASYRNASGEVRFRLEVVTGDTSSVSEAAAWSGGPDPLQ